MERLDADVQMILRGMERAGTPPLSTQVITEARRVYEKGIRIFDLAPDSTVHAEDVMIPDAVGVSARIYHRADTENSKSAALLWFHGGGYCVGSIESTDPVCRMFAVQSGYPVISIGYRLAPEYPFPAAVEDAFRAYEWSLSHMYEAGQTPRLVVGGSSAGGTLAAVVCILARNRGISPPVAQMLLYPSALGRRETESKRRFAHGFFLGTDDLDWFYRLYAGARDLDNDFRFAPIAAPDLCNLPQSWIGLAECDPLKDDGWAYARALQEAGNKVTCEIFEGMIHEFFQMGGIVKRARDAQHLASVFLSNVLAEAPLAIETRS